LRRFNFAGPRGNATGSLTYRWRFANGVSRQYYSSIVFFYNAGSIANRATAYRRPFQKSESALDRASGDGRSRLGYSD
jgi:hypothetical protein